LRALYEANTGKRKVATELEERSVLDNEDDGGVTHDKSMARRSNMVGEHTAPGCRLMLQDRGELFEAVNPEYSRER
jgi:hypothetical protein